MSRRQDANTGSPARDTADAQGLLEAQKMYLFKLAERENQDKNLSGNNTLNAGADLADYKSATEQALLAVWTAMYGPGLCSSWRKP